MWDQRYAGADYFYGAEPNDFLADVANRINGNAVLCLADGEGRNGVFLAQQGLQVTSVDSSPTATRKAEALAAQRGVAITAVTADLTDYAIGADRWDAVVSIFCHLPPALRRQVHTDIVTGLRRGGVLILEAYAPAQLNYGTGGPPTAEMMMTLDQLRCELPGLRFDHARQTVRDVLEGQGHTGPGAVVQLFATKP